MDNVKYYKNGEDFYKVNNDLKRITCISNGEATFPEYEPNIVSVSGYKKIKMPQWKQIENKFFLAKHFFWQHEGKNYCTTNEIIKWTKASTCGNEATVFHNGKIWLANDYYYPRISLRRIETVNREHIIIKDDASYKAWLEEQRKNTKWTDIKYCRHFTQFNLV